MCVFSSSASTIGAFHAETRERVTAADLRDCDRFEKVESHQPTTPTCA